MGESRCFNECDSKQCCCGCENCRPKEEKVEEHDWFLRIADEAWSEVLKEKIKEHIIATQDKHMRDLAKVVAEGNHEKWQVKMRKRQISTQFKEALHSFFRTKKG